MRRLAGLPADGKGRIELWLEGAQDQTVRVAGETVRFAVGDGIRTDNSCNCDFKKVLALATPAWTPLHVWCDPADRFSVSLLGG